MIKVTRDLVIGIRDLAAGIVINDTWQISMVMRQATIADAIAAIEKGGAGSSNLRLRIFKAGEQIESIGTITEIDGELLMGLSELDVDAILEAQDELEKKLKGLKEPLNPTST